MKKAMVAALCVVSTSAQAYERPSWMGDLPDQRAFRELVIPGTHDTGAYEIPTDLGETQDWPVAEQLNNGVRFLDVRIADCGGCSYPFEIRHGVEHLGNFHELILNPAINFLNAHPSEVILMSVSDEAALDKPRFLDEVVYASGSKFVTHVDPTVTLGDVRGKIVLIDRMGLNTELGTLALRTGALVDSVVVNGVNYGGTGGGPSPTLTLQKGEYVNRVEVRSGSLVDSLKFSTNFGNVLAGGGNGGGLTILENIRLVGITGRHGTLLDQISLHYQRPGDPSLYVITLGGNGGGTFGPKRAGIGWGNPRLHIQDEYDLHQVCEPQWWPPFFSCYIDYQAKVNAVINHLNAARNDQGYDWWVNFASANWSGLYIGNSAEVVNPAVSAYFADLVNRRNNGEDIRAFGTIMPIDYPNRQNNTLITNLLNFNFVANWGGAITPEQSCDVAGQVASQNSNVPRSYTFFNRSSQVRKFQWVDYNGGRVPFVTLNPHAEMRVTTYATHPFVVTDSGDACQGVYVLRASDGKLQSH